MPSIFRDGSGNRGTFRASIVRFVNVPPEKFPVGTLDEKSGKKKLVGLIISSTEQKNLKAVFFILGWKNYARVSNRHACGANSRLKKEEKIRVQLRIRYAFQRVTDTAHFTEVLHCARVSARGDATMRIWRELEFFPYDREGRRYLTFAIRAYHFVKAVALALIIITITIEAGEFFGVIHLDPLPERVVRITSVISVLVHAGELWGLVVAFFRSVNICAGIIDTDDDTDGGRDLRIS